MSEKAELIGLTGEEMADYYNEINTFKTKPSAVFEVVFNEKEKNKMSESIIIAPEKEAAGIDLDLFLKIMPAVRVGDRIVCTVGIEHIEYADDDEPDTLLAIYYQSGSIFFFDQKEEMELEKVLRAAIQKSEEAAKHQMNLQMENAQLKQEIARLMANQMQGKLINPGFGKRH